jgi:hypothetical protein
MNLENLYNFKYRIGDIVSINMITSIESNKIFNKFEIIDYDINDLNLIRVKDLETDRIYGIKQNNIVEIIEKSNLSLSNYISGYVLCLRNNAYNIGPLEKGMIGKINKNLKVEFPFDFYCFGYTSILFESRRDDFILLPSNYNPNTKTKKNDFIVGNWYKDDEGNYIKYKNFSFELNKHRCSEWINISDKTFKYRGGTTTVNLPKIDLSEIQQYLPDNHPDKFNVVSDPPVEPEKPPSEYKVGIWYIFKNSDYKGFCAAKFKKLSDCGKYFYFSEYIGDNNHKYYDGNWYENKCTRNFVDITNPEFQSLLPDNHVLKTTPIIQQVKYNIVDEDIIFANGRVEIKSWEVLPQKPKMSKDISIVDVSNFQFKRKKRKSII